MEKASAAEPDPDKYDVQEDDLAILMYTGGTTGLPKGVMLSHRSADSGRDIIGLACGFSEEDSTCFVLPIFHVSWWPILAYLLVGGKVCINRKPNLEMILKLIQDEKCTHMNLVPTIYGWMVDYPNIEKYDLSSLRLLTYAGSPFPVEVLKSASGNSEISSARDMAQRRRPAPANRLELAGSLSGRTEIEVPGQCRKTYHFDGSKSWTKMITPGSGQYGEICAKGKHIMMGYWKNPEADSGSVERWLVPYRRHGLHG